MLPILFTIYGIEVTSHGLFSLLGIIIGGLIMYRLAILHRLETRGFVDIFILMIVFGFIGAKASYFAVYNDQFTNFQGIFDFKNGGLISFGGFIFGLVAFAISLKIKKWPVLPWLSILSVAFLAGQFLGRIGDTLAGEYEGKYSSYFSIFENTVPLTLFEGLLCLILFIFFHHQIIRKKPIYVFFPVAFFYFAGRFVLDFWREEIYYYSILSLGQATSLFLLILSVIIFFVIKKRRQGGSQSRVFK